MMSSYLPPDLIEEILSRVPATSLKRLRSTCKRWNTLFKDQRFSEKHFGNAPKESLHIMLKEYRFCSISVNNLNVVPPCIEFKDAHDLEVDIAEVSNCDGLLLCTTMDNRLVGWNPCTRETRWIEAIHDNIKKSSRFSLGYKNDKSSRNYKILRVWNCHHNTTTENIPSNFGSEIYEFSSNSWRVLDDMDTSFFILTYGGISLKGNIYWLGSDFEETRGTLICFDFTTERSKRLCLPVSKNPSFRALSVFREEQLSVLYVNTSSSKMEIWVTNNKVDNEADLSWKKSFAVNLFPRVETETGCILTNLIIDEEKKAALSCITYWGEGKSTRLNVVCIIVGDEMYFELVPGTESYHRPQYNLYVPSLLQIH